MTAVISLNANPGSPAAGAVIEAVADRLAIAPTPGADGSWEFCFAGTYGQAHGEVVAALTAVDPSWTADVTLEYALAV
jgi:hypothetical protein